MTVNAVEKEFDPFDDAAEAVVTEVAPEAVTLVETQASTTEDELDELDKDEITDLAEGEDGPEVIRETQAEVMERKLLGIVRASRRAEPVSSRRSTALDLLDELRDHLILSTRMMMTDEEVDAFIRDLVLKSTEIKL